MIVWDRGTLPLRRRRRAGATALARGKLDLELRGHKLRGRWALVRTKGGDGRQWLFFKKADGRGRRRRAGGGAAGVGAVRASPSSELRDGVAPRRRARRARRPPPARRARALPARRSRADAGRDGRRSRSTRAGLALRAQVRRRARARRAPSGERAAAARRAAAATSTAQLSRDRRRRGAPAVRRLRHRRRDRRPRRARRRLVRAPAAAPRPRPTPGRGARRRRRCRCRSSPSICSPSAGHDLRALPLERAQGAAAPSGAGARRDALRRSHRGRRRGASSRRPPSTASRASSPSAPTRRYRSGRRSRDWLKIKALRTADLAVVGYVPGKGSRARRSARSCSPGGSDGELVLRRQRRQRPRAQTRSTRCCRALERRGAPDAGVRRPPRDRWRAARSSSSRSWSPRCATPRSPSSGVLRQPVLRCGCATTRRCRRRPPADARRRADERRAAEPDADGAPAPPRRRRRASRRATSTRSSGPATATPRATCSRFYDAVWPALAPYLRDRPVVLTRYPDGIDGKNFFQKNAPDFTPDWVPTCRIEDTDYFICNDLRDAALRHQLGLHPAARVERAHAAARAPGLVDPRPRPEGRAVRATWSRVARHIHALLEPLGAPHFVKTSGQDGLHVLIPLGGALTHDESRDVRRGAGARWSPSELPRHRHRRPPARRPRRQGLRRLPAERLRQDHRRRRSPCGRGPGAPVSTPLAWREVNGPPRPGPLHHQDRAQAHRRARRSDARGARHAGRRRRRHRRAPEAPARIGGP